MAGLPAFLGGSRVGTGKQLSRPHGVTPARVAQPRVKPVAPSAFFERPSFEDKILSKFDKLSSDIQGLQKDVQRLDKLSSDIQGLQEDVQQLDRDVQRMDRESFVTRATVDKETAVTRATVQAAVAVNIGGIITPILALLYFLYSSRFIP